MTAKVSVTFMAAALLCAACSTARVAGPTMSSSDSVRVEIHERTVHDTALVEVIREVERVVTRDTSSRLENEWAKSDASVSEGFLTHSLESKPRIVKVPVTVMVHDTLVVERKAETIVETVEVEREQTFWEQLFFRLGVLFVILGACQIGYFIVKLWCHR